MLSTGGRALFLDCRSYEVKQIPFDLAAEVPVREVRRALLLSGSLTEVAAVALAGGPLHGFSLTVGRPLAPGTRTGASSVLAFRASSRRSGR